MLMSLPNSSPRGGAAAFKLLPCPFMFSAGLLDGLFSNQKSKFGLNLEGLAMEDVGIFYGHLVPFMVFHNILWTFAIVHDNLVYFSRFGILYQENLATMVLRHSPKFNVVILKMFS
jgi:hypothetical protein